MGEAALRRGGGKNIRGGRGKGGKGGGKWKKASKRSTGISRGGISGFIAFGVISSVALAIGAVTTWRFSRNCRRPIHRRLSSTDDCHESIMIEGL